MDKLDWPPRYLVPYQETGLTIRRVPAHKFNGDRR